MRYILFIIILFTSALNSLSQDTVYVDYLDREYSSIPTEFIPVDTTTEKDDSTTINELLIGPSSNFYDTLESNYKSYYVKYSVEELQGGTTGFFDIDTNSVQLSFTTLSSVTGIFIDDSLKLDSASDIAFNLSGSAANTTLKIVGQIYHTTTFILVRHKLPAITTIYYDRNTDSVVSDSFASQFTPIEIKNDTTYMFDTTKVNIWIINQSLNINVPNTYSKYHLQYELTHIQGGYSWNVDTNNTYIVGSSNAFPTRYFHLSGNTPRLDSMLISKGSTIDFEILNINNSGRYQVDCRLIHTVDTIFINSMSTSINELANENTISVYPNPTKDYLYIDGYNGKEFEIINISGVVLKSGIIQNRIDMNDLTNGVYILKVEGDTIKVLKE